MPDCFKDIFNVFRPHTQCWTEENALLLISIKGYALYKIDVENIATAELYVASVRRKRLLRMTFMTVQRYARYFFLCMVSLSMYTSLLCLFHVSVALFFFLYISHSVQLIFERMCVF